MQHVGERKDPSIRNLVIVVVIVLVLIIYAIISFTTGDWLWFSTSFRETPYAVVLHCRGETLNIDQGSFHFSRLTRIMNESMSGRKRWDSLSMSEETYHDYQSNPQMVVVEFFYREPVRVHSTYTFYSNVDNLVVPLEGRHAQTNAIFGQNDGVPTGGSLHIESKDEFKVYLQNMELCPVDLVNTN
jgi:hypothetical protein